MAATMGLSASLTCLRKNSARARTFYHCMVSQCEQRRADVFRVAACAALKSFPAAPRRSLGAAPFGATAARTQTPTPLPPTHPAIKHPPPRPPRATHTPAKSVTASVKRPLRSTGQGRPSPFSMTPAARHTR